MQEIIGASNYYKMPQHGMNLSTMLENLKTISFTNNSQRKFVVSLGEVGLWFLQRSFELAAHNKVSNRYVVIEHVTYVKGLLMYLSLNYKHGPWKVKVYRDKTYKYHFYYGTKLVFVSNKLDGHNLNEHLTN